MRRLQRANVFPCCVAGKTQRVTGDQDDEHGRSGNGSSDGSGTEVARDVARLQGIRRRRRSIEKALSSVTLSDVTRYGSELSSTGDSTRRPYSQVMVGSLTRSVLDPDRGVKFETFCVPRVEGAMYDELRAMTGRRVWCARRLQSSRRRTGSFASWCQPSEEELANFLELPIDDARRTIVDSGESICRPIGSGAALPATEKSPRLTCSPMSGLRRRRSVSSAPRSFVNARRDSLKRKE